MRRFRFAAAMLFAGVLVLASLPSHATRQQHQPPIGHAASGALPVAKYPMDGMPRALFAGGVVKMTSAYAGKADQERRDDNALTTIGFVGNAFDTAGKASWLGSRKGYLSILCDTGGAAHDLSATTAGFQAQYVPNAIGIRPAFLFDHVIGDSAGAIFTSPGPGLTVFAVAKRQGTGAYHAVFGQNYGDTSGATLDFAGAAGSDHKENDLLMYIDGRRSGAPKAVCVAPAASTDKRFHVLEAQVFADIAMIWIDGAPCTMGPATRAGTYSPYTSLFRLGGNDRGDDFNGEIAALIVTTAELNAAERSRIRRSLGSFFGIDVTP